MALLFSDLDNTLVYSHRWNIKMPNIVVEYIDGREQGYMTKYTYDFLKAAKWLELVPVTTRTEEQYKRLTFFSDIRMKYSLVCNGGKLLVNGLEERNWSFETNQMAEKHLEKLNQAVNVLDRLSDIGEIHHPENYMFYAKCSNPGIICDQLKDMVDCRSVTVEHDRHKVYLFTNGVDKGTALERFKERFSIDKVIASGDDTMDVPMLDIADVALSGSRIFEDIKCAEKLNVGMGIISDRICDFMKQIYIQEYNSKGNGRVW